MRLGLSHYTASYYVQPSILMFYTKLFGFQACHSTEHYATVKLPDQIHEVLGKNCYILGAFID